MLTGDDGMLKLIAGVSISIINLVVLRQVLIDAGSHAGGSWNTSPVLDILQ